jgi:stage II sporulation protein D
MSGRAGRAAIALIVTVVALAGTVPPSHGAPEGVPRPPPVAVGAVELTPTGFEPLRVVGLHRYLGKLRLEPAADGLVIENRLSLERYLLGLNEVPTDWPIEALRAQAVAARTYARWTLSRPRAGAAASYGFDICASELCQVFSGADVLHTENGERWARAVRSTSSEVLTYEDEPILARYHSTSGGITVDNSDAFPGEPSLPYLRSVRSTTEEASPLFRWRASFRLDRLEEILRAAGWWGEGDGALARVHTVPSRAGLHYPDVALEGRRRVRRTAEELRAVLRELAPQLFPALYPGPAATLSGRLPETLPSNRIEIVTRAGRVEVRGRGWGHGVGMSQWGAHGLARRGSSYEEILAHYYPGTELVSRPGPRGIDVGIAWARPSLGVFGSFRVTDGSGAALVEGALGTWRFALDADGRVSLAPPEGWGRPLDVDVVGAPRRVPTGGRASVTVTLTSPARVAAAVRGGPTTPARTKDAGRHRVAWVAPQRPGRYRLGVVATSGSQVRRAGPVRVVVVPRAERATPGGTRRGGAGVAVWIAAAALLLLVSLGAASFAGTIRR